MTPPLNAVQISIYLSEADEWHHKPLHLELLKYLREQQIAGATVLHAVAGFTGRGRVKTATLVDAGGKLPLVLTFVDTADQIDRSRKCNHRGGRAGVTAPLFLAKEAPAFSA